MDEFRSFIALEIPKSLQNDLATLIERLKTIFPLPIRWVQPGNIHLTLKFMGNISNSTLESLQLGLKPIFKDFQPVVLKFSAPGFFPNTHSPKVLWIGMELPKEFSQRVNQIEKLTSSLGIPPEHHPFSPHLTLGRIHGEGRFEGCQKTSEVISSIQFSPPSNLVSNIVTIFKSELSRQGPVYYPLFRVELQKHG